MSDGRGRRCVEDAGARQSRPLLEGEDGNRRLVPRRPRHARRRHEAEVGEQLLDVAQRQWVRVGRRLADGRSEVVAGEEPDGNSALDPHANADDSGDGAQRPDQLSHARAERGVVPPRREARPEIDDHHAMRDREVAERRARRDRRAQPVAPLAACRPGEERANEPGNAGRRPMGGDRLPVPQEPHVTADRVRPGMRLAREREGGRHRKRERDARHAPWVPHVRDDSSATSMGSAQRWSIERGRG
jgi:hypothetical protein